MTVWTAVSEVVRVEIDFFFFRPRLNRSRMALSGSLIPVAHADSHAEQGEMEAAQQSSEVLHEEAEEQEPEDVSQKDILKRQAI